MAEMGRGIDTNSSCTVEDWVANWGHTATCKEECKKIDAFVVPQTQGAHMRGGEHMKTDRDITFEMQVTSPGWVLERMNLNAEAVDYSKAASN